MSVESSNEYLKKKSVIQKEMKCVKLLDNYVVIYADSDNRESVEIFLGNQTYTPEFLSAIIFSLKRVLPSDKEQKSEALAWYFKCIYAKNTRSALENKIKSKKCLVYIGVNLQNKMMFCDLQSYNVGLNEILEIIAWITKETLEQTCESSKEVNDVLKNIITFVTE